MLNREHEPNIGKIVIIGLVVLLALTSLYIVPAGNRGVLLTFGKPSMDSIGEGLHLRFPIAQTVKKFEVKTQKLEVDADSVSKDLQGIYTTIALNYHLKADSVPKLYQEVGPDFKSRVIEPSIQESVKAVMAKYKADELTDKRPEVSRGIKEALEKRLEKYHVAVDDFNIVNFKWSDEYAQAIENKQVAEQNVLKSQRELERIEIEAKQKKVAGEAEAYILKLQKQEITPDLIQLRQIEVQSKALDVQRDAIDKWNGALPIVSGSATPFISFESLPISDPIQETQKE